MDFTGKVVIVTGAGGDMGTAIVKKFTDNGSKAVLMDIREEAAQKAVEKLGLDAEHSFCVKVDCVRRGQRQGGCGQDHGTLRPHRLSGQPGRHRGT